MAESRLPTLRAIWAPKLVKVAFGGVAVVAGYDSFSSQFGLPKLGAVLGTSGSLLPWWGWLLILQAIFVYALFEYVRRMTPPPKAGPTMEEVEAAILRYIGEGLQRETVAETFKASDGRFGSIVEHFEKVTERLRVDGAATEKLAKEAVAEAEVAMSQFQQLQKFVLSEDEELREAAKAALREQREFQARMEAWVGQSQFRIRMGLRGVDQGFSALLDRERLVEMAFDITNVGDELAGPSMGKPLGDWQAWQVKFNAWNRAVEEWARLADKHRDGVVRRVFDLPRSEYKNKWGVEDYGIFPDHDAVHEYKTFCIISRNFHAERKNVEYGLMLAAFRSPSKKCRGDPGDEEDPMLTLPPPPEDYGD